MAESKLIFSFIKQKFPHFSRIFNAKLLKVGFKIVVFILLTGFLLINLFPSLPADFFTFEQAKLTVMIHPNDLSSHLLLVQEYLKRGDLKAVERELLLAQSLVVNFDKTTSVSILGSSLSPLKILEKIKNEPQRIKNEISFWEKVILEKPDYPDAYLQLAILNYQIYENNQAKEYLKRAKELDPNSEIIKQLEAIIR